VETRVYLLCRQMQGEVRLRSGLAQRAALLVCGSFRSQEYVTW
jgi:hypothetical protein